MSEWKPYTPTLTKAGSKNIKLPNGKVNNYYRQGLHVVTTVYEYRQEGKVVKMKAEYKRLSLWESLKFVMRTRLAS